MKCFLRDGKAPRGGGGGGGGGRSYFDLRGEVPAGATSWELVTLAQSPMRPYALASRRDFERVELRGVRIAGDEQMPACVAVPLEALLSPRTFDLPVVRVGYEFVVRVANLGPALARVELRVWVERLRT